MSPGRQRWIVTASYAVILFAYGATGRYTAKVGAEVPRTWVDQIVPRAPGFILPYLAFFPFLAIVFYVIAGRRCFRWHLASVFTVVAASLATFLILPTSLVRAAAPDPATFSEHVLHAVQAADAPGNCFPSLHASLTVVAAVYAVRHGILHWIAASAVVAVILASTLLVGQHLFVDILGGAVLGSLALIAEYQLGSKNACQHCTSP